MCTHWFLVVCVFLNTKGDCRRCVLIHSILHEINSGMILKLNELLDLYIAVLNTIPKKRMPSFICVNI